MTAVRSLISIKKNIDLAPIDLTSWAPRVGSISNEWTMLSLGKRMRGPYQNVWLQPLARRQRPARKMENQRCTSLVKV